jgi:hypothetical protein
MGPVGGRAEGHGVFSEIENSRTHWSVEQIDPQNDSEGEKVKSSGGYRLSEVGWAGARSHTSGPERRKPDSSGGGYKHAQLVASVSSMKHSPEL